MSTNKQKQISQFFGKLFWVSVRHQLNCLYLHVTLQTVWKLENVLSLYKVDTVW